MAFDKFKKVKLFFATSKLEGSESRKNIFLAPNKEAPIPKMPLPEPKSAIILFLMSLFMKACHKTSAAISLGVWYCSRSTLGEFICSNFDKATSNCFFELIIFSLTLINLQLLEIDL